MFVRLSVLLCLSLPFFAGQRRNAPERVIAIVPIIGSGTVADPHRPLFFPTPNEFAQPPDPDHRPAIVSYRFELGDDGKTAIAEYTGFDRASLRKALKSDDPNFRILDHDKLSAAEMNAELKKVKKSFDLQKFLYGEPVRGSQGGAQ